MNFKQFDEDTDEPFATSDFFYDLFYGGYIDPEDFLEPEDAKMVREAIHVIENFQSGLIESGWVEEC